MRVRHRIPDSRGVPRRLRPPAGRHPRSRRRTGAGSRQSHHRRRRSLPRRRPGHRHPDLARPRGCESRGRSAASPVSTRKRAPMSRPANRSPGSTTRTTSSPSARPKPASNVAQATLERALLVESHSRSELDRAQNLLKSGGITDKDLKTAELADRDAAAQVLVAKAQVEQAAGLARPRPQAHPRHHHPCAHRRRDPAQRRQHRGLRRGRHRRS